MQASPLSRPRLSVYFGPELDIATHPASASANSPATPEVELPLDEVLPLLAEAYESRRTWLEDFGEDPVKISQDLYEVLLAYRHYRRPVA